MDLQAYRHNRAQFPEEELRHYDGRWVAFSADGKRIVASAVNLEELETQLLAAGENPEDVGVERIVLDDESLLGGAEFL